MSTEILTSEQIAFLEECALEFSDRFTDSDLDYKKMYDSEIPPPPIMHPWYGRNRMVPNRYRPGGSQHDNRDNRYDNRYRDRDYGKRDRRDNDSSYRDRDNSSAREHYSSRSSRDQHYKRY